MGKKTKRYVPQTTILKNKKVRVCGFVEGLDDEIVIETSQRAWEQIQETFPLHSAEENPYYWLELFAQTALYKLRTKNKTTEELLRKTRIDNIRVLAALIYRKYSVTRKKKEDYKYRFEVTNKVIQTIKATVVELTENIIYFTREPLSENDLKGFYAEYVAKGTKILRDPDADHNLTLLPTLAYLGLKKSEKHLTETERKILSSLYKLVDTEIERIPNYFPYNDSTKSLENWNL